ncbi:hypothetical protein EDEG_03243 [Edhazardia aedis USNM 41457]|uniref:Uncharacterized protein n=1 Tax=Edhazardia aedis (strain USNM 41457) TaxID=1003232 RepID=J9D3C0_EDHAE|nr:hypothetical protein EDEG_03243 [Edhazardia aedis USNM 41457]|eukprot:EJW02341.1 hypothetical protein EDEG_03243 [Edhazardia aedis USNM 41457]
MLHPKINIKSFCILSLFVIKGQGCEKELTNHILTFTPNYKRGDSPSTCNYKTKNIVVISDQPTIPKDSQVKKNYIIINPKHSTLYSFNLMINHSCAEYFNKFSFTQKQKKITDHNLNTKFLVINNQ